ncbi:MAG: tRNA uridine-5-carboxymethylaminomethyl(34) synthesis enzyme MnmG [Desulfobacteraceae bacterium]|nr:tRNA uridine-5-carboxymethylaminomethyl(34) synthesis enzyme MnmG [Desulfobacteraceae bacterium]
MNLNTKKYDVIVIGAGHAGCEAALAAAGMGCDTLLMTIDLDKIASMPCSPSIGGMAKGQLVKEIDALGGYMAKVTDSSAIQYRTLNTKKGPAVHSTRTQNDKSKYHKNMKLILEKADNLDIKQAMVENFIIENNEIKGLYDNTGFGYSARTVVLCTGTFLKGVIHIGSTEIMAGRAGEFSSIGLADSLAKAGFTIGRMKTGTPPRLHLDSVDLSKFDAQESNPDPAPFSFSTKKHMLPLVPSYMGRTNQHTHDLIRKNLKHSALYGGHIKGKSARYCPSFEDKIVKFPERESHRVILEYEGLDTKELYASGLGNSLPLEIQTEFVRSVKGLEQAEIMRPGYAIEYDYINPLELVLTLETKRIKGLFLAGQVNGTSGYEEAAAQGLWAGINAACKVQSRPPFILDRSQGYMGVMIDDLVTRGTSEPYRMFTSRAEYRLVLREDNADLRLTEIGNTLGLIDNDTLKSVQNLENKISKEITRIKKRVIKPSKAANQYLESKGSSTITNGMHLDNLLKRFELSYSAVEELSPAVEPLSRRVKKQVEIEIKYEGYISRQTNEIKKYKDMEKIKIPEKLDYSIVPGLSNELVEKLGKIRPASLAQASRIDGITPAAISVIMIAISAHKRKASS